MFLRTNVINLRVSDEELQEFERIVPLFGGDRSKALRRAMKLLAIAAPEQDETPAA